MLEFKHEWRVVVDPTGEDPALQVHCSFCKAVVEVLMLDSPKGSFLRTHLLVEGVHPVSQEELEAIGKTVYAQFVEPSLGSQDAT